MDTKKQPTTQGDGLKQTTLRLETKLFDELKAISKQTGLTISSLLIAAIWQKCLTQNIQ